MDRSAAVANAIQSMYGMSLNYLIEILKNQTFLNGYFSDVKNDI